MSFLDDIGNAISDGVSDIANLAGDAIEGAGDLIGAAGNAVGALGGMLGQALNGIGSLLEGAGSVLGGLFPPLGLAMSLGGMMAKGLGACVTAGTQLLQHAAQLPKFAGQEMNNLIHSATAQLTGGGQTNAACDKACADKWGSQISDFWTNVQTGFVDNCTGGPKKGEDWLQVLVNGLKGAINDAFGKMQSSEQAISGGASGSPDALAQFQKDAGFFNLVMTTATQTIKESIDAAKAQAQAA